MVLGGSFLSIFSYRSARNSFCLPVCLFCLAFIFRATAKPLHAQVFERSCIALTNRQPLFLADGLTFFDNLPAQLRIGRKHDVLPLHGSVCFDALFFHILSLQANALPKNKLYSLRADSLAKIHPLASQGTPGTKWVSPQKHRQ